MTETGQWGMKKNLLEHSEKTVFPLAMLNIWYLRVPTANLKPWETREWGKKAEVGRAERQKDLALEWCHGIKEFTSSGLFVMCNDLSLIV